MASVLVEILEDFVHMIVEQLVVVQEEIEVKIEEDEEAVKIFLHVSPGDIGKVIGKKGVIAQSIRVLTRAIAFKNEDRRSVFFDVVDNDNDAPLWNKGLRS